MNKLQPYGSFDQAHNVAKVGKLKSPSSLVDLMPSSEVAAKVGPIRQAVSQRAAGVRIVRLNAR